MERRPWYQDSLCKVHLDMHCPEWHPGILENIDLKEIVTRVAKTGSDALYFFAKDHYGNAYYDTKIGHKHANVARMGRDLLAEAVREGKRAGVRIIAYYSVVWDIHMGLAHPEWLQRDSAGRSFPDITAPNATYKWLTLCHNSGYTEYAAAMLDEIAERYEVDGFHLDMFHLDFGNVACYCETCRGLFRERTGREIPSEPTWDDAWRAFLDFRYDSVDRCMHALVDAVHAKRPGLFVTTNYHGSPGFDWRVGQLPVCHSLASSMSTGETYTPAFGDMYPGMEARFLRGVVPGKPMELVCWRMNRITDYTTKPLHQFRWEALTTLANGASVMVIDQPFHDGRLDPVAYDRIETVFREVEAKKEFFQGEPLTHVAIYYSAKTRDWYGRGNQPIFQKPVVGAYKALAESHFFVDFLFDETATPEKLAGFPVTYLPNVAILSAQECAMFEAYVANGGTLIATFDTSLFDESGVRLPEFRLSSLFGVSYEGTTESDWHFWRGLDGTAGKDIDPRYAVLSDGQANRVKPTTATGQGELLDAFFKPQPPDRFFSHAVHPPFLSVGHALFLNRYSKGLALYVPHPCDAAYAGEHELPEHRLLIRNLVNAAEYKPIVRVLQAPLNVDVVVRQEAARLYVHLLGFNPTRQSVAGFDRPVRPSIRMDEAPMYRAVIEIADAVKNATAFNASTVLRRDGNNLEIVCEDVHEVLVLELQAER